MIDELLRVWLDNLERRSFLSRCDGCYVVMVECEECKEIFAEELEEAKEKVVMGVQFICLGCDVDAEEPVVEKPWAHFCDWFSAFRS